MEYLPEYERLMVCLGESDQWQGRPLWQALLEMLQREHLAGATVLRGLSGFGAHSHIKAATLVRLSADLPLVIVAVDRKERIEAVLPLLTAMIDEGLVTLEPVRVIKYAHRQLPRIPAGRRVSESMTPNPVAVHPTTSLVEVARLLLQGRFTSVPVVDDLGYLAGIVADGDFLRWPELALTFRHPEALDGAGNSPLLTDLARGRHTAAEIMTAPVVSVGEDSGLAEAAGLMVAQGVKSLPVVDGSGVLVGMVSRSDILREVAAQTPVPAAQPPASRAGRLGDLGRAGVTTVSPMEPLPAVIEAMAGTNLGRVVATDDSGLPLGVISDGDLVARLSPEARPGVVRALLARVGLGTDVELPEGLVAGDVMTTPAITAPESAGISEGMRLLAREGCHSLVLVDEQGRAAGLLDRQALLRALLGGVL